VDEKDLPLFKEHVIGLSPGSSSSCELRLRHKNGNIVWVNSYAVCLQGPGYPGYFLCGGLQDITNRKQAEEMLRESEGKFRNVVENANEIILIAQDGLIKYVNKKVEDILHYSSKEMKNKPFVGFIHQDDRKMVSERHVKRLKGEDLPGIYPFRIVDVEGNAKWVEINTVVIQWQGKPATLNFLTNITKRKLAEQELLDDKLLLEQKNAALNELLEHMERAKLKAKEDIAIIIERIIMPTLKKLHSAGVPPKYLSYWNIN
jgi:PAS domain S-box-containing protein